MTGLNTTPIMHEKTAAQDAEDILQQTLSLLRDRRQTVSQDVRETGIQSRSHRFQSAVSRTLQGSILPADQRRILMNHARELGLRPFEATLMIALAQDRARNAPHPIEGDLLANQDDGHEHARTMQRPSLRLSTAVVTGVLLGSALILLMGL